jgi:hypothetical protein
MMINEVREVVGIEQVFGRWIFPGRPPWILIRSDDFCRIVVLCAGIEGDQKCPIKREIGPGFPTSKIGRQSSYHDRDINGVTDRCGHADVSQDKLL